MIVHTSEPTNVVASSHDGHASGGETDGVRRPHAGGLRDREAPATALGAVLALPRSVRIIGAAGIGFGALLAVGVPLATLTPLVFLGGCLGMHLLMGHGMSHGDGHRSHRTADGGSVRPAEDLSPRDGG